MRPEKSISGRGSIGSKSGDTDTLKMDRYRRYRYTGTPLLPPTHQLTCPPVYLSCPCSTYTAVYLPYLTYKPAHLSALCTLTSPTHLPTFLPNLTLPTNLPTCLPFLPYLTSSPVCLPNLTCHAYLSTIPTLT